MKASIINRQILSLVACLLSYFATGQNQRTITLSVPETGNQTHTACEKVVLEPGFTYTAQAGSTFVGQINEYQICDIEYGGGVITPPTTTRSLNKSLEVGTIPGSFNISSSGAATYSISLMIPPGSGTIAPKLAFVYNSQAGNGLMGMGWSLSGISSINRVGQTIYHDGKPSTVRLDTTDRFSLDGNRLIKSGSGTCDAPSFVYYTESETFSRITACGTAGSGPSSFRVETKDGSTLEYGTTVDSRIEAHGSSTALTWLLNKITDSKGNYMEYEYYEDPTTKEYRLEKIKYTGNTILPYNEVRFVYGKRNDPQYTYIAGSKITHSVLLVAVQMFVNQKFAHQYKLEYGFDANSYLTEVIEQGSDYKSFNSTLFNYGNGEADEISIPTVTLNTPSKPSQYPGKYIPLDIDQDGKKDLVGLYVDQIVQTLVWDDWSVMINNGNENFNEVSANNTFPDNFEPYDGYPMNKGGFGNMLYETMDVNGDGREDLVFTAVPKPYQDTLKGDIKIYCYLSNGNGFNSPNVISKYIETYTGGLNDSYAIRFGDFNGDQKLDAFIYFKQLGTSPTSYFNICLDFGNNNVFQTVAVNGLYNFGASLIIDKDGDGKGEIAGISGPGSYPYTIGYKHIPGFSGVLLELHSDNSGVIYTNTSSSHKFVGDYNGDGITDILSCTKVSQNTLIWKVSLGKGNGLIEDFVLSYPGFQDPFQVLSTDPEITMFVRDINADGKSDIIELTEGSSTINAFYSAGTSFTKSSYLLSFDYYPDAYAVGFGDFNGDGNEDIVFNLSVSLSNLPIIVSFNKGIKSRCLSQILDGFNNKANIEINTLSSGTISYLRTGAYSYPVNNFKGAIAVVSKVKTDNGVGGQDTTEYSYKNCLIHRQGKGFLGFSEVKTFNKNKVVEKTEIYNINTDFYFMYPDTLRITVGGTNTQLTTYTNTTNNLSNKRYYNYTSGISANDLLKGINVTTAIAQDNYGNITSQTVNYGSDITEATVNTYEQKAAWIASRCSTSTTTTIRNGPPVQPAYSRSVNYINSASTGLPTKKTLYPTKAKEIVTDYTYDPFGNPLTITVTGNGMQPRITTFEYDDYGRFETKNINPLGHVTESTFEPVYGNITISKDPNLLTTTFSYDGFGRLKQTIQPTGHKTTVSRKWISSGSSNAIYSVETNSQGNSPVIEFFDILSRNISIQSLNFEGTEINTEREYNAKGQLSKESLPYLEGGSKLYTTYTYKPDGRLLSISLPSGEVTSYSYNGTTTTMQTLLSGKTKSETIDAKGMVIATSDDVGSVTYKYHSCGKPRSIITPGSEVTTVYDEFGMQKELYDPNTGKMTYVYNALGELTEQTDSKGKIYTMTYDKLGRIETRTGEEGLTTYHYDGFSGTTGLLTSVTGFNGINQTFTYDAFNRLANIKESIEGVDYTESYLYDVNSRVVQMTYPGGFSITKSYNGNGYLEKVMKSSDNSLIWQCLKTDQYGHVTKSLDGNGVVREQKYDNIGLLTNISAQKGSTDILLHEYSFQQTTGNLLSRRDDKNNMLETFTYDKLDRLTKVNQNAQDVLTITYAASGNISRKSDVGIYEYELTKTHAVSGISNPSANIPSLAQEITYTAFNKAGKITEGLYELNILYGPDYHRRKQVLTITDKLGTVSNQTKYFLGGYEKTTYGSNSERELSYITTGDGLSAIHAKGNGIDTLYYVYTDHLGSISAVSDTNGNLAAEYSYDAWGRRRNPTDWTYTFDPSFKFYFERGYTGHEHLDQFSLINMNGRMYDYVLARMLSPDNLVIDGTSTQMFNRYSYAANNPLKYTDPTGDFIFTALIPVVGIFLDAACWGAVIGGAGYTASVALSNGGLSNWTWSGFGKAAGIGAISGVATAGIGSAFGAIGSGGIGLEAARAITHGVSNAIISGATGGDPLTAFASGGLGSLGGSAFMMYGGEISTSILGTYAFSGLTGGLGAELTGGNFWQGAAIGVMSAGLNHLQQGISYSIKSGNKELNPKNYVIKKVKLREEVKNLYEGLVNDELCGEPFDFQVTGGDRYACEGKEYSSTNHSAIKDIKPGRSGGPHTRGVAVDLRIKHLDGTNVSIDVVRPVVTNRTQLMFDKNAMPWHYGDRHYHLQLKK